MVPRRLPEYCASFRGNVSSEKAPLVAQAFSSSGLASDSRAGSWLHGTWPRLTLSRYHRSFHRVKTLLHNCDGQLQFVTVAEVLRPTRASRFRLFSEAVKAPSCRAGDVG